MKTYKQLAVLVILALSLPSGVCEASEGSNATVLGVAQAIADGGGYNRQWKGSGTPREIVFKSKKILSKGHGTYCSGFTFTVAMDAMEKLGLSEDKTVEQIKSFQRNWYGNSDIEVVREKQSQIAVVELGVGRAVKSIDARAGDYLQFWRSKTGHSVVFLGWIKEKNEDTGERITVGLRYRSSQGSTNGVGDVEERFKGSGGSVDRERMYFARLDHAKD